MSRTATVLVSFIGGAASMFFLLAGSNATIAAQPVSAQYGIVIAGAAPIVPRLHNNVSIGSTFTNLTQQLDGLELINSTFNNVTLEYSGGAFRLVNPTFSGPIRVSLKGCAANTEMLRRYIVAIEAQRKPKNLPPNAPIMQLAEIKEPTTADLISPYGQK